MATPVPSSSIPTPVSVPSCARPQRPDIPQRWLRTLGAALSPALIANYAYDLAKEFNQYYHDVSILKEEDAALRDTRLMLIGTIASVLVKAMDILGIRLPERM